MILRKQPAIRWKGPPGFHGCYGKKEQKRTLHGPLVSPKRWIPIPSPIHPGRRERSMGKGECDLTIVQVPR